MAETIDHGTLSHLVEAGVVRGAHIVGQPGGWAVMVRYGMHERPLAAQRSRNVRLFRKFETLVSYLKKNWHCPLRRGFIKLRPRHPQYLKARSCRSAQAYPRGRSL